MNMKPNIAKRSGRFILVLTVAFTLQSCYQYRVVNTVNDPASVQYHKKVMWSYVWGAVNNPRQFTVPDCTSGGIDEVRVKTNFGNSLLTIGTLGLVCPVTVQWKCHKPCQSVGDL
jgi:hypothetical protein